MGLGVGVGEFKVAVETGKDSQMRLENKEMDVYVNKRLDEGEIGQRGKQESAQGCC